MNPLVGTARRWPDWAPRAAQLWSVLYGALALHWLLGGRAGFPIADVRGDPPGGSITAAVVAAVLLLGCVAGILSAQSSSPRATVALVIATGTAAVGTFGLALSGVGIIASGKVERPLALVAQLAALIGALLLFATIFMVGAYVGWVAVTLWHYVPPHPSSGPARAAHPPAPGVRRTCSCSACCLGQL